MGKIRNHRASRDNGQIDCDKPEPVMDKYGFTRLFNKALKIIGPAAANKKEDVRRRLGYGLMFVDRQRRYKTSGRYGVKTAQQKEAAGSFAVALHSLEMALVRAKRLNLHRSVFANFPMDEKSIEIWRARAKEAAATKPVGKSKLENMEAVRQAASLLRRYDIKLSKARTGKLCKLAAIFSGNPDANLYAVVCDYLDGASAKDDARKGAVRPSTSG
jgi:hypothetical protein